MTTLTADISALVDGQQADAADVVTPISGLKTSVENVFNGVSTYQQLCFTDATDLTIASDAITITQTFHNVDTEAAAATDNLATINGGNAGDLLILRQKNSSRDITLKHGTGNIFMTAGADFVFTTNAQLVMLLNVGGSWIKF